jgi:hypothetical protein
VAVIAKNVKEQLAQERPFPMLKLPIPVRNLKGSPRLEGAPGTLTHKLSVTHRKQDGTEDVKLDHSDSQTVPQGLINGPLGISGVSFGLTIPGPEKSYMAARIDAICYLPHGPTDQDAKAAMQRAAALVQEQLELDAREAKEFFDSWRRQ